MSRVARSSDFDRIIAFSPVTPAPARKGLLRRALDAMLGARERQSQRDIDSLVSWRDGRFTDSFEREIAERSYSDGFNFRR